MTQQDENVIQFVEKLVIIASTYHLTPKGYDRNKLLRPINEFFKQLRRAQSPLGLEEILAVTEDRIFTAIDTIRQRDGRDKAGKRQQEGACLFVDTLGEMIRTAYSGNLSRVRAHERILKSCYITVLRHHIQSLINKKAAGQQGSEQQKTSLKGESA